jgi:protein SCO1
MRWRRRALGLSALLGLSAGATIAQGEATGPAAWDAALKASQAVIGQPLGGPAIPAADSLVLRDALQRKVRLADYRGRPLVVSFVYTGCFQACPIATQGLARAVRTAREALGSDSFQVVTIGFNQPFDSPEAMGAFARQSRINDPRWAFLSPQQADVPALARALGFSYQATPKGFDHITQATIVDADGVVYAQVYGDLVELPQFIGPLKELLTGQARQTGSVEGLWRTVKLYCTVYDPSSGGYRLNYSLFFEIFCGVTILAALAWFMGREWHRRV